MKREVRYGAILSYILIVLNAVYGLVISPFLVSTLGTGEYGVYKTIGSLTASIMVLDLGIGGTMQRYIARFNARGERRGCSNFAAMGMLQAAGLSGLILLVCGGLYFLLDDFYGASFTMAEMERAKQVFVLSVCALLLHVFENVIHGVICGLNRFVFGNSLKILSLGLRAVLYLVLLPLWKNAVAVILITLTLDALVFLAELCYLIFREKIPIRYDHFDRTIFAESIKYTAMMFVQSLTVQVNGNLDNVVVGAVLGTAAVTLYSFGLTIYGMFQQLSCAISGVMLPTVTDEIVRGADNRRLEDVVIHTGRIQFLLLGAALCGFLLVGKDFLNLWLGEGYSDVWIITLILMLPSIWELSQNVGLSILRARNLLGFRTVALLIGLVLNFVITWFGTRRFGYIAAAAGTAASVVVADLVLLNLYYYCRLHLNVLRIFYRILKPTLPGLVLASGGLYLADRLWTGEGWLALAGKILVFLLILGAYLFLTAGRKGSAGTENGLWKK